jgi:hypothetical protein
MDSFADIMKGRKTVKPPAHQWQDLALNVIKELGIPEFKRSAVFKTCKEHQPEEIKRAVNDTKELCQNGQKWQYFFKIIGKKDNDKQHG